MKKFNWIFLNIITFGLITFYAKKKAAQIDPKSSNELIGASQIDISIEELISEFGGASNIASATATISTLKIDLIDKCKTKSIDAKKYKIKGQMSNGNQIVLVTGDNAKALATQINKKIKPS